MSSWKHIGHVSAALVPAVLAGCCDMSATRPYHEIPYCCDRTAGSGVEYYCGEAPPQRRAALLVVDEPFRVAQEQMGPPQVEPAAGDKVFHDAVMKR